MTTAAAMIFFFLVCHAVVAHVMPNPLPKDPSNGPPEAPRPILTSATVLDCDFARIPAQTSNS